MDELIDIISIVISGLIFFGAIGFNIYIKFQNKKTTHHNKSRN